MKKQIDLDLWHPDCWMLEVSREHPGSELIVGDICSDGTDVFATVRVHGLDYGTVSDIATEYAAHPTVRSLDLLDRTSSAVVFHTRYGVEHSLYGTVVDSSMTPIREVRIRDDRERWTLLCDADAVGRSIAAIEEVASVTVRRVGDLGPTENDPTDPIEAIDALLSPRQRNYLLAALSAGYYDWPRNTSVKALAEEAGVSNPTALEHLRKGEAAVLGRVLGELREHHGEAELSREGSP
jgi:predicted DNA binding protein